jgi:hypothetical protein
MKRWSEFADERPEMAGAGRALIYQFRVGLGYLATVRKDGAPRVHPVCPVIANGGLYVFELRVDHALHAKYGPRPSWPPAYTRWSATAE